MKNKMITLLLILTLSYVFKSFAHDDYYGNRTVAPAWDVNEYEARSATNCHWYELRVRGGEGSARIMDISPQERNIVKTNNFRNGYVCFNGNTQLEVGKFNNVNIDVELYIEHYGQFVFRSGDSGQQLRNGWYRSFWDLGQAYNQPEIYPPNNHYTEVKAEWDVSEHIARNASNCYWYELRVSGGEGSARIMSISPQEANIVKTNRFREGYVCFSGHPQLELGKFNDTNIHVELTIYSYGHFVFSSGDQGQHLLNGWYRYNVNL